MRVIRRVGIALGQVAWGAIAFGIIAVFVYAVEGEQAVLRDGGLRLRRVLLIYVATAVSSGVLLGLLKPLVRGSVSAALVGIPVAIPSALAIMLFSRKGLVNDLTTTDIGIALAFAVVFGPLAAAYYYSQSQSQGG